MSYLSGLYTGNGEADIRAVVQNILYGTDAEPPRGHWIMLYKVDLARPCCVNEKAGKWGEASNKSCKACHGLGFFFTRSIVRSRRSSLNGDEVAGAPLRAHIHAVRYYVAHDVFDTVRQAELSRLVEIRNSDDGKYIDPIETITMYHIQVATPFRCDSGRIEYWALDCEKLEFSLA